MKAEIAKAIALLAAEYDLPPFPRPRLDMWMQALQNYPAGSVIASAQRYIMSNKFKPQLADIVAGCVAQMDGSWPSADEAWGLMPKSENESAMLTTEMSQAMASAAPLLEVKDKTAARMTFRETYSRLVERAKIEGRSPAYYPSFGSDAHGRVAMLANAVNSKQISLERATEALPEFAPDLVQMLGITDHPLLAAPKADAKAKIKALLLTLKVGL